VPSGTSNVQVVHLGLQVDVGTPGDGTVTNAKLADMAANTVKVRDANSSGDPSDKALATTEVLIGDGTGFTAAALSGDATMTNAGAVTIADNAVTLAKMAGLVRGKIIVGDSSGDPSALTVGSANQVLTSDGTDASWAAASGTTINNNAASSIITGSGSANTLEANSLLPWNGYVLGINTATDTWNTTWAAVQLKSMGFMWSVGDSMYFGHNAYYDQTDNRWEYIGTGEASYVEHIDGTYKFANAPAGVADGAITWTTRFTCSAAGAFNVVGAFSKGSGSFKIDHPLPEKKDTHHLVHSFIEGPKADLIYRGRAQLVNGSATVNIDDASGMTDGTFVLLCDDVQCFTSNETDWDCVRGNVSGNVLTIDSQDSNSSATISWMVVGDRKDEHMIEQEWTDANGKPIVEPLKEEPVDPSSDPGNMSTYE
jgi:hypothetical protein